MTSKGKIRKLLRKIKQFLDSNYREQRQRRKKIALVIKRLKKHANQLKAELLVLEVQKPLDEKQQQRQQAIRDELAMIKMQRKKALGVLRELRRGE